MAETESTSLIPRTEIEGALAGQMAHEYFPISLEALSAKECRET